MDCGDTSRSFFFFPPATKFGAKTTSSFLSYVASGRLHGSAADLPKERDIRLVANATGSSGAIALHKIAAEKNVIGHLGQVI
jgi:hypothetical protein